MAARKSSDAGRGTRGEHATAAANARTAGGTRELRIIGGRWRGRRWQFPAGTSIRPTPDRVRETLFNWLMTVIPGARCLDAFTGSGALGLEALSRGASFVTFIDSDRKTTAALRERLRDWTAPASGAIDAPGAAAAASVVDADALDWLAHAPVSPVDIVFLDPPFAAGLLPRVFAELVTRGWLNDGALVYTECAAADSPLVFAGPGWVVHRSGQTGEVGYHLLRRATATRSSASRESSE